MIHLVQIGNGGLRRVAVVDEPQLSCLTEVDTVYELVHRSLVNGASLSALARSLAKGETLDYDAIYLGKSPWRLLTPIDVPGGPARLTISGTGLTHLGSAKDRQAMHTAEAEKTAETMTDSMQMFEWGVQGGRPAADAIGVAPEWFYKGSGEMLRAPFEPLTVPAHGEDGGEEAEVAGIYVIGEDGAPVRIGIAAGNEFSDHKFEKRNYLNLAGSKLRACSVGPELVIGAEFGAIAGKVRIRRGAETIWSKAIETGEQNMCHSLANVEHHHFKFENHRRPGDVHVHFFGAHSLSFGDGVVLQDGDRMEVEFEGMGRPLINPIKIEGKETDRLVTVRALD
jgi:hypothetical protein